jgi:hypothetical protein
MHKTNLHYHKIDCISNQFFDPLGHKKIIMYSISDHLHLLNNSLIKYFIILTLFYIPTQLFDLHHIWGGGGDILV